MVEVQTGADDERDKPVDKCAPTPESDEEQNVPIRIAERAEKEKAKLGDEDDEEETPLSSSEEILRSIRSKTQLDAAFMAEQQLKLKNWLARNRSTETSAL